MYLYLKKKIYFNVFSEQVRIGAAYYIGTEKKHRTPLLFVILAVFLGASMVLSEIFARMKRKKINPAQASNRYNNQGKNMVISNLIPFTTLNLIFALDVFVNAIVKLFNPTQMGVPKLSIHGNMMLLMLVFTNSAARSHFKRKLAAWRGVDFVEVVDLQQQQTQRGQARTVPASGATNPQHPNQIYQETVT